MAVEAPPTDRWKALAAISLAQVGAMSTWFSAAAAFANVALIGAQGHLGLAIAARFLLGFLLAGVYPTGMKLMTGWFRQSRGLAIGTLVGALTLGSASPHLIAGASLEGAV